MQLLSIPHGLIVILLCTQVHWNLQELSCWGADSLRTPEKAHGYAETQPLRPALWWSRLQHDGQRGILWPNAPWRLWRRRRRRWVDSEQANVGLGALKLRSCLKSLSRWPFMQTLHYRTNGIRVWGPWKTVLISLYMQVCQTDAMATVARLSRAQQVTVSTWEACHTEPQRPTSTMWDGNSSLTNHYSYKFVLDSV